MIPRYTLPEMGEIWTDEHRFQKWLDVEIAVCEVHAERGTIPARAVEAIKRKARIDAHRINELERTLRHDVLAFTTALAEKIGSESRFVHYGLTSSDVVDTANALLLREAGQQLLARLDALLETLKRRAHEFKDTPMMGRTHGVHAEPTTFGLVLANFYAEGRRNRVRLETAIEQISFGKVSGAVGTFAHLDPVVEEKTCARLGLKSAPISTQIIQRDRHAEFLMSLALIAAGLEKIAVEIRHLERTEVREAQEPFGSGQKGSSAMPHKRNPVTCEQVCGLSRIVRSYVQAALENIALWHERDITHSSVERVILADSCILTDYMLAHTARVLEGLVVFPDRMLENIQLLRGVTSSGGLLIALTEHGMLREDAYSLVQRCAARVWDEGVEFRSAVEAESRIVEALPAKVLKSVFDLKAQLRNVDQIFQRVFGSGHGS